MAMRLVLVGGGRMGEALLAGLVASGWAEAGELAVVELLEGRREALRVAFPGVAVLGAIDAAAGADGAVLAVKPPDAAAAAQALGDAGVRRLLSVAAGVTTATLEAGFGAGRPVVRAMPNTPALVGQGAAAIAAGAHASRDDVVWAMSILEAVGTVATVPEKLLDAVTGLTGSGPAYLFLVAEALIEAGVLNGLPRDTSVALTRQLFVGAAALMAGGEPPEALRAAVTSPAGTTAAGLRVLEQRAVRAAFLDAVSAATERSRALGG